jgi:hypothetical protein
MMYACRGFWSASNAEAIQPSLAYRTQDAYACSHLSAAYASRTPLVDIGASDSIVPSVDYTYFPDLQMLPATAGGVVPIYNIPELSALSPSSPLILSRTSVALIYLGQIKFWNDSRILADNTGSVKAALSTIGARIFPVVRSDSSGTTSIFTNALSSFSATFTSEVGAASTPPWCNSLTDEVQVVTITGCTAGQVVQLTTVDPTRTPRQVAFGCNASVSSLTALFKTAAFTNVSVSKTVSGSTVTFQVGYSDANLIKKNWYRPVVSSVSGGITVSLRTLQEGGYLNAPYSGTSSTTLLTQSVFVSKVAAAFTFNLTLNSPSGTVIAQVVSADSTSSSLAAAVRSAISAVVPSGYLANVTRVDRGSFSELRVQFASAAGATTYISGSASAYVSGGGSAGSNNIAILTLLDYSNYPIFSVNGLYSCYKRSLNYHPFSFYSGSLNPGVLSVVSIYVLLP